jgi:hypothetical protein
MKHTPGPWKRDSQYMPEEGAEGFSPYIVDSDGRNVGAAMMIPENEMEFVANARLIAAAPDLLEAAKWLMKMHGRLGSRAWDAMRTAIKKAEADS